ncbi:hypothetical protein [Longilinea arvoryzae]|nr:hypothetical protein [Longilinea arvoryzae]
MQQVAGAIPEKKETTRIINCNHVHKPWLEEKSMFFTDFHPELKRLIQ